MELMKTVLGTKEITFETGRMAKQANGSVVVRQGDTMILCTVCASTSVRDGQDFFPLTVEFQEKTYAAGRIPGGFFKREGKLSESEILTSRLIDRPIRPLFPEGFMNEVQIICTVISQDEENPADTLASMGASAALMVSDLPFEQPVAAVRLGRINGQFVINPSPALLKKSSDMDVLVAGTETSIIMVEGSAAQLNEATMAEGLFFAHREMQPIIKLQKELKAKAGKAAMKWSAPAKMEDVISFVKAEATEGMKAALSIREKQKRYEAKDALAAKVTAAALTKFADKDDAEAVEKAVDGALESVASDVLRQQILKDKTRIDGRDLTTVRPITIETGVLPRTHGSCLFTRGETQALVTCTLGAQDDSQTIDALMGSYEKNFLLHYNFPPFSVGETKMLRGPSRRDIGHGHLAERALAGLFPDVKAFPYTVRIVSDILESNGSSSMATVCGGSLALMDAGVPFTEPVAGIAMGLIAEGSQMEVLTDILGDEDHLGDMDFKVTGTKNGITAFQLDTKISGISLELMQRALNQARDARLKILDIMKQAMSAPKAAMSTYAPRITTLKVRQAKIKDVIGPGGKNIKSIVAATGAKIDINDDGTVNIFSSDSAASQKAVEMIELLTGDVEIGKIYTGTVRKIMDFGAFIAIAAGVDGLCHVSELTEERVRNVSDVLKEGDQVDVMVLDIDRQGRIKLSMKEAARQLASGQK